MTSPPTRPSFETSGSVTHSGLQVKRPRLGQISFVNVLPIVLPYERQHSAVQTEIIYQAPSQLNSMFSRGELDIGAMSSFFYLENPTLRLVPGVSISCKGPVGSVLFFSKCHPSELLDAQKRIVVSAQSATSTNLLKILFSAHFGFIPNLTTSPRPDLEQDGVDAVLVIGDRALEVDEKWSLQYNRIDLGAWWFDTYKRPMVFGVWAARKQWVEKHPDEFARIVQSLKLAKASGLSEQLPEVLKEAERRTGLCIERLRRYFTLELNFDLDEEHLDGLALYQQLAAENGLLASL